jgi:predicted methyltransferase MtxX (methanogen marker protein 4)
VEVRMPPKGKELKINHNLNVNDIINVNVIIVNGVSQNLIMRSQVDMMSQKALYNWYIDKEHFVLIRPNNVNNRIKNLARFQRKYFPR